MISQAEYLKVLRPLLPELAFKPNSQKLFILAINLLILVLGWTIARDLDRWSIEWLWLYLPLSLVMGNSIIICLFAAHDAMHGSTIKQPMSRYLVSFLALALLWMPPTLWKSVHNHKHHTETNAIGDPDRMYLVGQNDTWGKWIQNLFVPSSGVNWAFLALGMATSWVVHTFRHITSILIFNRDDVDYVPAPVVVSPRKRQAIAIELVAIGVVHLSILAFLKFNPLAIGLGYILPLGIGYAGVMFYIYTNHFLCPMTDVNDPLVNSVSLKMPKIFDLLHFNFSYHTEHHLFPSINSDYYPVVQELLQTHYPESYNLIPVVEAWQLLMQTPRHYRDEITLTDSLDRESVICPCAVICPETKVFANDAKSAFAD
ncbi:fatty acid desaturase family protein [Chamaesiphon sp. VAR_69_metabat_338]|uniref:fatty acid desaturase family protein n=1 Tax=Chamaesiphon sp. VAR_69_metabat_338 TaxID=2964704 RepID=UPI0037BF5FD7